MQAVVVPTGIQSANTLVVRDVVSRISADIDAERRTSDELDLQAPEPSLPEQSIQSGISGHYRAGYIEKAKIPAFSGKIEDYPDFKDQFRDLTENCGHPPSASSNSFVTKSPARPRLSWSPPRAWQRHGSPWMRDMGMLI